MKIDVGKITIDETKIQIDDTIGRTLWSSARYKALHGGRGGGKSWGVALYLIIKAAEERKRIVCARQFQNSIRDSSKGLIEQRIHDLGLSNQFFTTGQSIIHKNGSEFSFHGLERNIESIRSLEGIDIVWVEEARTISNYSLEVLIPTIRKKNSELIFTWNPELQTDPIDVFFRGPHGPPPNSIVTSVNHANNPFFRDTAMPEEMELMRQHNFDRYRHIWLGEYDVSYVSRVFTNVIIGRVDVPINVPPCYGIDFGFNDPTFVVKVYVLEATRQIYIAAEASGVVPMDQLPLLIDAVAHDPGDLIKADSSQPGTIEFLQARGYGGVRPARKGQGSVQEGINFLRGYQLVIDPNCEQMREEARLYSFPTDRLTGQVIPGVNPIDAYNHGFDALRYAVEDLMTTAPAEDDPGVYRIRFGRRRY